MLNMAHKFRVPKSHGKKENSIFQTVFQVADPQIMLIIQALFIGFINGVLLSGTI